MLNPREYSEKIEADTLSPYATKVVDTKGRQEPIEPCPYRTAFQQDRDRIIHCNSFRRLKHKTQVFLSPEGDHYRTRLTHTLEVSQIGRTVARAARLNEDLVEAIAMGHDLGHTPFGHAGEQALDDVCSLGYIHAQQSVRVVEVLENDGKGLNLTFEVRDGIAHHSSSNVASTLEGRLVRYADKIAYMNHDIEDAIRAGVLTQSDIPWQIKYHLGNDKSQRITTFVASLIENTKEDVAMSPQIMEMYNLLRGFMFENVYNNPIAKGEEVKAKDLIRFMYTYFVGDPSKLPSRYQQIAEHWGVERAVCDYISGMSDRYAVSLYSSLFIPKSWTV